MPEAEPHVAALRLAHDSSAVLGVPAHITILFPFAAPESVDEHAVQALIASHPAFAFELRSVARFDDGVTYLAPFPARPFVRLTRAIAKRWPGHPPYEGLHAEVIPHLTVAECRVELDPPLPIACHAHEVLLLAEEEPGGRFVRRRCFPLGCERQERV